MFGYGLSSCTQVDTKYIVSNVSGNVLKNLK